MGGTATIAAAEATGGGVGGGGALAAGSTCSFSTSTAVVFGGGGLGCQFAAGICICATMSRASFSIRAVSSGLRASAPGDAAGSAAGLAVARRSAVPGAEALLGGEAASCGNSAGAADGTWMTSYIG